METLRKRKPVLGEEDGVAILTNRGEGEYGGGKGSQDKRQAGNRGLQTLRCSQTAALGSRNSFWTSCIFSFQCLWSVDLSLSTWVLFFPCNLLQCRKEYTEGPPMNRQDPQVFLGSYLDQVLWCIPLSLSSFVWLDAWGEGNVGQPAASVLRSSDQELDRWSSPLLRCSDRPPTRPLPVLKALGGIEFASPHKMTSHLMTLKHIHKNG